MSISRSFSESRFNQEVMNLIRKCECREIVLDSEKEQICKLRFATYLRSGAVSTEDPKNFNDWQDEDENGKTFGLYISGRLASSIRLHVATPATPICPAMNAFSDCLRPMFDWGMTVVDPTRIVMDVIFARKYRNLPYATIRVAWMACEQNSADILLATVSPEQQSFYRGTFGHRVICSPRPYPSLKRPVGLMALGFPDARERVMRRRPYLRSAEQERVQIFGSAWPVTGRRATSTPDWMKPYLTRHRSSPLETR